MPNRKAHRLKNYNYSQNGYYFTTICTHNKQNIFGNIIDGKMHLNIIGKIVNGHIHKISEIYDGVFIDIYVIMPNHIHFIIAFNNNILLQPNKTEDISVMLQNIDRTKMLLPKIIQQFKAAITKEVRHTITTLENYTDFISSRIYKTVYKNGIWLSSFHEHVIRDEISLIEIRDYIKYNPLKWKDDRYYL